MKFKSSLSRDIKWLLIIIFLVSFMLTYLYLILFSDANDEIKLETETAADFTKWWSNNNETFKGFKTDFQISDVYSEIAFQPNDYDRRGKLDFGIAYDTRQWNPNKKLHIVVVPHSHNDPGWLQTFEQYFRSSTKPILDTIVDILIEDRNRKFVWAEMSYLSMWWSQANSDKRSKLRYLIVETKQLEIVTGGWVMTDEANSNYYAIIEQMISGHEWLRTHVDSSIRPKNHWAIDPFGHSPTMPYLLKQMGFDSMVINRIHYKVKNYLAIRNRLEFNWCQNWYSHKDTCMPTHVLPFHYSIPDSCGPDTDVCCQFDYDRRDCMEWRAPPPRPVTQENLREQALMLLDQYRKKSQLFGDYKNNEHNIVMIPLGDDFRYSKRSDALKQLESYRYLMDYMNADESLNVDIKFGTLSDYFHLLKLNNIKINKKMETFSGDFFTYADREEQYWSGYFTSRPFNKRLDRSLEAYLRSAEIIYSMANYVSQKSLTRPFVKVNSLYKNLILSRHNLGLFQHHDAITGTSKSFVVKDYTSKLYESINHCKTIIEDSIGYLLSSEDNQIESLKIDDLSFMNEKGLDIWINSFETENWQSKKRVITFSNTDEEEKASIIIYNSNLNPRHELITLKINTPHVVVINNQDGSVISNIQISLAWPNTDDEYLKEDDRTNYRRDAVLNEEQVDLKHGLDFDKNYFELTFEISVKPMSLQAYVIQKRNSQTFNNQQISKVQFYQKQLNGIDEINMEYLKINKQNTFALTNLAELISFHELVDDKFIPININDNLKAYFSSKTGLLEEFHNSKTGETIKSKIKIIKYMSYGGVDGSSGAYLFMPRDNGTDLNILAPKAMKWIRVEHGNLKSRVCVNMTLLLHCVEIYPTLNEKKTELSQPYFVVTNMVDLRATYNTEIAMHIETNVKNEDTFYTDLNGFQFIKRVHQKQIPLQGNVFPMPTAAFMQDNQKRLNILTSQPLGVASLQPSNIQVFLDRHLNQDDGRGLSEAITDSVLTPSKFIIFFENINNLNNNQKEENAAKHHPSLLMQWYSYDLLNPLIKLIAEKETRWNFENKIFLNDSSKNYPCDLRLINMRTMEKENNELPLENQVGMIFHRILHEDYDFGFNASIKLPANIIEYCDQKSSNNLSFQDMFQLPQKESIQVNVERTYLTLVSKYEKLNVNDRYGQDISREITDTTSHFIDGDEFILSYVKPMHVEGFRVHF